MVEAIVKDVDVVGVRHELAVVVGPHFGFVNGPDKLAVGPVEAVDVESVVQVVLPVLVVVPDLVLEAASLVLDEVCTRARGS